ncbi:MAG: hybrid sensor histidine kinase/response regulator [Bacteroidetes bacterium 4572_77]|nr:MAG: hybrid sensor histidine kinase/response regulator [Bacteroidetes bacterium 4572_77]
MQSFLLDISEIKRKEQELKSALEKARESDRLKSAFLSNMSHEIRTPMNGILGFTGLLKDPQLSGDEQHRYLEIIERSGHRMLSTINDIIDISRIEAGQVEVVKMEISINKLLDEQYDFFNPEAESKGLELIYYPTLSAGEAFIITDKHKLEGILSNLIKNALKFTKHGKVTFGCALVNNSTELEIFVTDTGIGIPQSRLEAIFNRFEQADIEDSNVYEGSGLGLTISKSYVEMLGGNIRVSSKEAYGSSFKFTIPYLKKIQKEQKVDAAKKDQKIALKKLSIIVAEDDKPSKFFFKEIFMHTFEELIFTSSGRETIDLCKENPEIDFILMDIKMPNINGYDATREIRKFNNKVIIIAQTAFAMSGDKEKAIDAGCNDYITKPIDRNSLLERLLYHSNKGR